MFLSGVRLTRWSALNTCRGSALIALWALVCLVLMARAIARRNAELVRSVLVGNALPSAKKPRSAALASRRALSLKSLSSVYAHSILIAVTWNGTHNALRKPRTDVECSAQSRSSTIPRLSRGGTTAIEVDYITLMLTHCMDSMELNVLQL